MITISPADELTAEEAAMVGARFNIFKLLLILVLAAGPAAAQVHSVSEPMEIRGQVRFARGGAPVDNVVVRLEALSGGAVNEERTDRLGKFRFAGLSPMQYFIF